LALNKLVPHTSPLMNRIEFVGNALFIPFFLIGVGMLIDFRVFFSDIETIIVAATMTIVATYSKFLAAWITQKTFKFSAAQRDVIFGLSNAQAAATLAAILVGYNVILGVNEEGEPIRLLGDSILNGTILMILVTCTVASFAAQKGAKNIVLSQSSDAEENDKKDAFEKILLLVNNPNTVEEMVNLSVTLKSKKNKSGLIALNVVDTLSEDKNLEKNAKKILDKAAVMASSTDNRLTELMRYDNSIVNGITSVVKEHRITDLILGLHKSEGISDSFLGDLTENVLSKSNITTLIYKSSQPLNTIKRHVVVVPEKAEKEIGFPFWLLKIWNIAKNSGGQIVFYAPLKTLKFIREVYANHPIDAKFEDFDNWDEFLILSREIKEDDNIIVVLSRKDYLSYNKGMLNVPSYLDKYFSKNNFLLIYPMQAGVMDNLSINYNNPSVLNPLQENLEKLDEIGKTIGKVFRKKK